MKKIIGLFFIATLIGCNCLSQIPDQYAYMDKNCVGHMPNILKNITTIDNCDEVFLVIQVPSPGQIINDAMIQGIIRATDKAGNQSEMLFNVYLIDTIAPRIMYNDTLAFTFDQANGLYKTFVAWIQYDIDRLNGFPEFKELQVDGDSVKVWYNSIAIYDN